MQIIDYDFQNVEKILNCYESDDHLGGICFPRGIGGIQADGILNSVANKFAWRRCNIILLNFEGTYKHVSSVEAHEFSTCCPAEVVPFESSRKCILAAL